MPLDHLEHYFCLVKENAESKLRLVIDLCNSEIEKKFVAYLFSFFVRFDMWPTLVTLPSAAFRVVSPKKFKSVYIIKNYQGLEAEIEGNLIVDPLLNEQKLLLGFRVRCIDVTYEILPQYPVFDQNQTRYLDFAINMRDYKTGKILSSFAIECDGFEWHHTLQQLNADNRRSRFVTKHNFKVIRFTGSEIHHMNDETVIELENTMYHTAFAKDSNLYKIFISR